MNQRQCENIINSNFKAVEDSFMYFLHEKSVFKENKYVELCNAIEKSDNKALLQKIIHTYRYIIKNITHHFNKDDLFEIKNFDSDIVEKLDELDYSLDVYIKKIWLNS